MNNIYIVYISYMFILYLYIYIETCDPNEQCSKPRLVGLYKGLYYPVIL